ncbi:ABC transporter ATP-binding protein [Pusillimonas sp. DMV24BSW_D]|uniref:ABC transporter ATP-binding protein n=1 Tax=Neopusillimonas aestuarii TaxID=2716226 RepID=UPI00140AF267|nr:ABC transporter ATP-binding protein [Pusillimonas sp. DMV24BSW_D]QIM48269.1 ABC transporter ATP-binding protein [Pusillimonas sp. DMV24BSW_D]
MSEGYLKAQGVSKTFMRNGQAIVALEAFDLSIAEGEFVSIVGPSGCGKSTFLHMVGGFEPRSAGTITLAGTPVSRPGPDRGMLFQDYALFPWRTVLGNVTWSLEVKGIPKAQRVELARKYIDMVGLSKFENAYPAELSGGMRQRVALARTLVYEPQMLLMDEPFGALDAQTRELMQEELTDIWQANQRTVLFVTHDIEEALYLSDRVIVFTARPGRIKADMRVNLPRPRSASIRKSPEFIEYYTQIWDMLRDEVLRAREAA